MGFFCFIKGINKHLSYLAYNIYGILMELDYESITFSGKLLLPKNAGNLYSETAVVSPRH